MPFGAPASRDNGVVRDLNGDLLVWQPEVLLVRVLLAVATGEYGQLESETTRRELVRAVVFFCGLKLGYEVSSDETQEERLKYAIAAETTSLRPFFGIKEWVRDVFVEKQRRADAIAYLEGAEERCAQSLGSSRPPAGHLLPHVQ